MKQKQNEEQKQTTKEELLHILTSEEEQDNKNSNSETKQLIEREQVEETPFNVITINGVSFGTFGQYRITEEYNTKKQCEHELKRITWNNIIKIMTLVHEMLNNQNK